MMNERIRELWVKAASTSRDYSWAEQTEFLEKFAKLIVRECANIADVAEPYKANDLILKHFGVEE